MSRRSVFSVFICCLLAACAAAEEQPAAYVSVGDLVLYLGQDRDEVAEFYGGDGEIRELSRDGRTDFAETFPDGTRIDYDERGEIYFVRTSNPTARTVIDVSIGDLKADAIARDDGLWVSGDYAFYPVDVKSLGPVDPNTIDVILIFGDGVLQELALSYAVD